MPCCAKRVWRWRLPRKWGRPITSNRCSMHSVTCPRPTLWPGWWIGAHSWLCWSRNWTGWRAAGSMRCCWRWTSIISSASMTVTGTRRATRCCGWWRNACATRCARWTTWPASAAKSSLCCAQIAPRPLPWPWRNERAPPSRGSPSAYRTKVRST